MKVKLTKAWCLRMGKLESEAGAVVEAGAAPFKAGDRVVYVPNHARDDRSHPDCERGCVSSVGSARTVFVQFDSDVWRHGADSAPVQCCDPATLVHE